MDGKGIVLEDSLGLTASHTKTFALQFAVNLQGILKSTLMARFTEYWLPLFDQVAVDL